MGKRTLFVINDDLILDIDGKRWIKVDTLGTRCQRCKLELQSYSSAWEPYLVTIPNECELLCQRCVDLIPLVTLIESYKNIIVIKRILHD